ncbi:hypothetical protein Q5P01_008471 [Channa striata]|uniref:Uncharacterized protein n=1 Tax=Channa striata TaxID=64152 RepID=A0AA88MZQ6_CHASR|nr:hypothetical protein Q5P01_008471 [Channa striata]
MGLEDKPTDRERGSSKCRSSMSSRTLNVPSRVPIHLVNDVPIVPHTRDDILELCKNDALLDDGEDARRDYETIPSRQRLRRTQVASHLRRPANGATAPGHLAKGDLKGLRKSMMDMTLSSGGHRRQRAASLDPYAAGVVRSEPPEVRRDLKPKALRSSLAPKTYTDPRFRLSPPTEPDQMIARRQAVAGPVSTTRIITDSKASRLNACSAAVNRFPFQNRHVCMFFPCCATDWIRLQIKVHKHGDLRTRRLQASGMDAQLTTRVPKAERSKAKDEKSTGFSTDIVEECLRKYAPLADREKFKDLKPFMFAALPESVLRAMQLSERLIQAHSETTKTLSCWLPATSAARDVAGSTGDDNRGGHALPSKRSKSPDYAYRTEVVPVEKLLHATHWCKLGANCCQRPCAYGAT